MPKPNVKSAIIKLSGSLNSETELYLDVDDLQNGARITIFGLGKDNQAFVWQGMKQGNSVERKKTFKVTCKYGYSNNPALGAGDVIDVTITVENSGPDRSPPFQSVVEIS